MIRNIKIWMNIGLKRRLFWVKKVWPLTNRMHKIEVLKIYRTELAHKKSWCRKNRIKKSKMQLLQWRPRDYLKQLELHLNFWQVFMIKRKKPSLLEARVLTHQRYLKFLKFLNKKRLNRDLHQVFNRDNP